MRFSAQFMDGLFDTWITFIGYAKSEEEFTHYAEIVHGKLQYLHRQFDIYSSYDDINNLHTVNANAGLVPVEVSPYVIDLLLLAQKGYYLTGGVTNIALGPVLRIWHEYRTQHGVLPPHEKLAAASIYTDISFMTIDEANNTVFLEMPGMSLDVGSIGKGYAAGLAIDAAMNAGMHSALLNAGGQIEARNSPPDRDYWNIGIVGTDDVLRAVDVSVAVAGGYERYFVAEGRHFGHIIDPETLFPADRFRQVTVVHPDSWLSDVLSTALFILPQEEGAEIAARFGAQVFWELG